MTRAARQPRPFPAPAGPRVGVPGSHGGSGVGDGSVLTRLPGCPRSHRPDARLVVLGRNAGHTRGHHADADEAVDRLRDDCPQRRAEPRSRAREPRVPAQETCVRRGGLLDRVDGTGRTARPDGTDAADGVRRGGTDAADGVRRGGRGRSTSSPHGTGPWPGAVREPREPGAEPSRTEPHDAA